MLGYIEIVPIYFKFFLYSLSRQGEAFKDKIDASNEQILDFCKFLKNQHVGPSFSDILIKN